MRYHALAADFDGTLAHHGVIDDATWEALRTLRDSGRRLIMVTGRELEELLQLLPEPKVFDRIVAENGAVLYCPATKRERIAAPGPPSEFVAELIARNVGPISVGRAIVATWEPHQDTVLHVIREQGLELQVIFNKGAVMVLPSGVNKATGLALALHDLGLSAHNVVAVGDAENDHALLASSECGVAVDNALPSLKHVADLVMRGDHGRGVAELIDMLLEDDLASAPLHRHEVRLGQAGRRPIMLDPYAPSVMVCGTSGSGKSTLTTGLLERLRDQGYQFAIVDPEGDYASVESAVVLGGPNREPLVEEVLHVLQSTTDNVVVNLLGVSVEHRPEFFTKLLLALADLHTSSGRPHWLVVDEAHHLLPASWDPGGDLTVRTQGTLYITVHPGSVAKSILRTLDTVLAVGEHPEETLREFARKAGLAPPEMEPIAKLDPGHAIYWRIGEEPIEIETERGTTERRRHSRKYTEGNLGHERCFFFRGPAARLNLKARNLHSFIDLGEGVDEETWLFHLQRGDYSNWLRTQVKDVALADAVAVVEAMAEATAEDSRRAIRAAIEARYTLPVDEPTGRVDPTAPPSARRSRSLDDARARRS
ncbi:MAG TPA: HAD-IIB family hydrolase [Kofleriaceae bacterium]|jgi:HAD superfamily hydrolase (TIGR01484 family)|nr:HAD-IIB family hydrolase [Kofleriaceae bacterium]